jgi:hypothetical protein
VTHYRLEANVAVELDVELRSSGMKLKKQVWVFYFWKNYDRLINEFSTTLWPFKKAALASVAL